MLRNERSHHNPVRELGEEEIDGSVLRQSFHQTHVFNDVREAEVLPPKCEYGVKERGLARLTVGEWPVHGAFGHESLKRGEVLLYEQSDTSRDGGCSVLRERRDETRRCIVSRILKQANRGRRLNLNGVAAISTSARPHGISSSPF